MEKIRGSTVIAVECVVVGTTAVVLGVFLLDIILNGTGPNSILSLDFTPFIDMVLLGIWLMVACPVHFIYTASTNIYLTDRRLIKGVVVPEGRYFNVVYEWVWLKELSDIKISQYVAIMLVKYYSLEIGDKRFGRFTKNDADKMKSKLQSLIKS